jgi:hypothetical protein
MHEMFRVTGFQQLGTYTLRIEFDDGRSQVIDFEPILYGELYGPLRDSEIFRQVQVDSLACTLVWPNDADFDPETLHNWPQYRDAWVNEARAMENGPQKTSMSQSKTA